MTPRKLFALRLGGLASFALALASCGESDVGMGEGSEGSGGLTAQLRAICVERVENNNALSTVAGEICDCASRRARDELSVADIATGDTAVLQDIIAQCADESLGIGTGANSNEAEIS